jgi:hypothetical protein
MPSSHTDTLGWQVCLVTLVTLGLFFRALFPEISGGAVIFPEPVVWIITPVELDNL